LRENPIPPRYTPPPNSPVLASVSPTIKRVSFSWLVDGEIGQSADHLVIGVQGTLAVKQIAVDAEAAFGEEAVTVEVGQEAMTIDISSVKCVV